MIEIDIKGLEQIRAAIRRNPETMLKEVKAFLIRSMAVYRKIIQNKPWEVGDSEGGAPVATRHLIQSHQVIFGPLSAAIGPGMYYPVSYAEYVHEGTSKMKARPWMDYAAQAGQAEVDKLAQDLLTNVSNDLAN